MREDMNPYEPPAADLAPKSNVSEDKFFSHGQVMVGTFIGGPLAGTYFIQRNFLALGKKSLGKISIVIGSVFTIALIVVSVFLPKSVPGAVVAAIYSIAAMDIVTRYQFPISKNTEEDLRKPYSNWWVASVSVACLFVSIVLVVIWGTFAESLGIL